MSPEEALETKSFLWKRSFFWGLIKMEHYAEYRGEATSNRYKHFIKIKIPFREVRWTIRSPHPYKEGPVVE